tara:strand:+ start:731 stop:1783 length:1053 start_codon:yes stop_codon:yes gene_type:complete
MPKVLSAIFSYEDMKKRFAQDNPDDPYTRRADLESGIYELDKWLIRVDDEDKAISTVGFKEHPSHTVVGGMYATAKGREIGGNNRALQDAREPQLNQSKPLVAAFGHRYGDNARWIANAKRNGWSFPDSENWEQMSSLLPQDVLNAWISKYPENMAIRSIRGEGEFAKCIYLDDPYPDWFNMLKIKKFYPTDSFDATGVKDERGEHQTFPAKGLVVGNAIVMFTSHYFDGHNRKARKTIPITSQVYNTLLAAKGRNMWTYVNDDPNDYSYVLVEYITGNDRINRAPRGQPRSTPNAFRGMGIDAMLNFYHYTEGGGLPNFRQGTPETNIVPIFYKNEETNNIKPGHRIKR